MDKEMEKALKSAVKNSLVDLQKHIKGEMQEIVPIFRIYTIISNGSSGNNDADWMVVNEPSHLQLKTSISDFIQLIIKSTSVVYRLEVVFRSQHAKVVETNYKREQENATNSGGAMSRHNDNNNLTEEQKWDAYKLKNALPEPDKRKSYDKPYVELVTKSKDINVLADHITKIVDEIKA